MNIVDIVSIVIIVLGALIGFKKGAIKGLVQLIGLVAIVICAFQFKGILGNFFIKHLPFFNFGGPLTDLYTFNFIVYEGIAFIVIFILLYCILNILINLSGILDLLVKMTIILEIPNKIIGTVLGMLEALVFIFVLAFGLLQFGPTQSYVMDSTVTKAIVERTPVVNDVFRSAIIASEEIYNTVDKYKESTNKLDANLDIIRALVKYGIVSSSDVQTAIDNGKLHMDNVVVAS